jgi:hypothetical protein
VSLSKVLRQPLECFNLSLLEIQSFDLLRMPAQSLSAQGRQAFSRTECLGVNCSLSSASSLVRQTDFMVIGGPRQAGAEVSGRLAN